MYSHQAKIFCDERYMDKEGNYFQVNLIFGVFDKRGRLLGCDKCWLINMQTKAEKQFTIERLHQLIQSEQLIHKPIPYEIQHNHTYSLEIS
jgi:hypothetical protein